MTSIDKMMKDGTADTMSKEIFNEFYFNKAKQKL